MNKKKIFALTFFLVAGLNIVGSYALKNNKALTELEKYKVFEMDFNNNELKNNINDKIYPLKGGDGELTSSINGSGIKLNGAYFQIPINDMNILSNEEYVTVSFLHKKSGNDVSQILCAFGLYNLYFSENKLGFNTGETNVYETEYTPSNDYTNIIAVFHKSDIKKNKLYINGVKQLLKMRENDYASMDTNPFSTKDFYIGNWEKNNNFALKDNSSLDEINVYKANITDVQAQKISRQHKIPDLRIDTQNGSNVGLSWSTEILGENVIYSSGFEDGDDIHSTANSSCNKIVTEDKYSGEKSLRISNSNVNGNNGHGDGSVSGIYSMNTVYGLIPGMKFSANVKMKSNDIEDIGVIMSARGTSVPKNTVPWHSRFGGVPIIVGEDTAKTPGRIVIQNFEDFYNNTHPQHMNFIANKIDNNYGANRIVFYKNQLNTSSRSLNGMPNNISYKKGDILQWTDTVYPLNLSSVTVKNDSKWRSYNFNGVLNESDYDSFNRGLISYINLRNNKDLYIDDIKFGHATKVRLYKDNVKIYEGYESKLNDNSIDNTKPNEVSNIKTEIDLTQTEKKVKFKFNPATDNGTIYNYNISAIDKNGIETPKSKTQSVEVKSGIKGYSYVINKNANTTPSNEVNTTSTELEYSIPLNEYGDYYLHIKSIDNKGNASNTIHYKLEIPKLTAVPNHKENMIRLDWTDMKENTYKVYQQKPGNNEFQTVGTTDFNKNKQVKILNLHPNVGGEISFTTWDGENIKVPISASLKKWMEEPNSENPKGYGKGVVEVTPVDITLFNENPDKYLKNSSGEYEYDVVMIGSYDSNGSKDITDKSLQALKNMVDAGRGLLLGHDTVNQRKIGILALEYADVRAFNNTPVFGVGDTKIKIIKKGLLTNYPWSIDGVLTIPRTHTTRQIAPKSDTWMDFVDVTDGKATTESVSQTWPEYLYETNTHSNNFYLSSKNNIAVIQTGHSNGQATPDEQKLLANTLFYLNQLGTDNFLDDKSGQDVTAPNKPSVLNYSFEEEFININLNKTEDNGSDYKYYIEAENKNGNKTTSNIAEATIKSGFKGYSYVIDNKEITEPDNKVETINTNLKIKASNNKVFIHIKAIDNVGNESETLHYKIEDLIAPTLEFKINPNEYTKENVLIDVTAQDNGSGVKEIILPSGQVIKGTKASFTATQNGTYSFIAIDKMNNKTTQSIVITNIDREKPTVTISNNKNWTNKDVQIKINSND